MGNYLPTTEAQQQEMLEALGLSSLEELYRGLPQELILKDGLDIPEGKSELELMRMMSELAGKNKVYNTILRGAGGHHRQGDLCYRLHPLSGGAVPGHSAVHF